MHLLAEERLDWMLAELSRSPSALGDARLSFHQKLKVCQALLGQRVGSDEWRFLSALNALRNTLSHNVEVPDVEGRIDAVIGSLHPDEEIVFPGQSQRLTTLKNCVMVSCAILEGVASVVAERAHAA